ncbi:MAG: hypothetical protein ACR2KX_20035 [Chitinophagaceae bacterium]
MNKELYYRLTIGAGFGSGYPLQEENDGISVTGEFAIQREKNVYALGLRSVIEFDLFSTSYPNNSISSIDITYGKVLINGKFFSSVSAGIGFIEGITRGKYLSSGGPGWFDPDYYEKIRFYRIGIPISAKMFWVPLRFYGIGLELYVNINIKNTFYGIIFCHQFGKLSPKKLKMIPTN